MVKSSDPTDSFKTTISSLKSALLTVWTASPRWGTAHAVILVVSSGIPFLQLYYLKLAVDSLSIVVPDPATGDFFRMYGLIGVLTLLFFFGYLFEILNGYVAQAHSMVVGDSLYRRVQEHSIRLHADYFEDAGYYDSLHRAVGEAGHRPGRLLSSFDSLFRSLITLVGVVIILTAFKPFMVLLLFAGLLPAFIVRAKFAGRIYHWQTGRTSSERLSWYYHWLLTGYQYAKEIRLFQAGTGFINRFKLLRDELRQEKLSLSKRRSLFEGGTAVIATAVIGWLFFYLAGAGVRGTITAGAFIFYFQLILKGVTSFRGAFAGAAGLYENNLFFSQISRFFSLPTEPEAFDGPSLQHQSPKGDIEFRNVSFSYTGSSHPAISNLNFVIPEGKITAIVGDNASGKSTIIKLLSRLYDPSEGIITIGGIDSASVPPSTIRQNCAVLFQDFARYHLPFKQNIILADSANDGLYQQALSQSGAEALRDSLPQGDVTLLGRWLENGEELSGGEWQKIALARTLSKPAPILILDEPTASMSAIAETRFYHRLREICHGRTAIIISHRLALGVLSDQILVMDKGSLAEAGSHTQLMEANGMYSDMFKEQGRWYNA